MTISSLDIRQTEAKLYTRESYNVIRWLPNLNFQDVWQQ